MSAWARSREAAKPRSTKSLSSLSFKRSFAPESPDHDFYAEVVPQKCQHPRQVHFLIGNHELAQATDRLIAKDDVELNDLFKRGVRETGRAKIRGFSTHTRRKLALERFPVPSPGPKPPRPQQRLHALKQLDVLRAGRVPKNSNNSEIFSIQFLNSST